MGPDMHPGPVPSAVSSHPPLPPADPDLLMARGSPRYRAYDVAGRLLLKARLPRFALPMLDRAVALHPELGVVHARRARALSQLGRWEEAALGFQAALLLDPGSQRSWSNLLIALANLGRWDEAAFVCQRASIRGARRQVFRTLPSDAAP